MNDQIINIHDACESLRKGYKWAGTNNGGITTAHNRKAEGKLYSDDDRAGENFWELHRQISFMVMGSEPFSWQASVDSMPEGKFDCLTAEDWITIAACLKRCVKND